MDKHQLISEIVSLSKKLDEEFANTPAVRHELAGELHRLNPPGLRRLYDLLALAVILKGIKKC